MFLANLSTIGQVGVTYRPALEQLLVLLPPSVAAYGSYGVTNNPTGLAVGGFTLTIADRRRARWGSCRRRSGARPPM